MKKCASLAAFARSSVLHNLQRWFDEEQLTAHGSPTKQKVLWEKGARSVVCIKDICEVRQDVVLLHL